MKKSGLFLITLFSLLVSFSGYAEDDIYRIRMFFGLSLPGGGAVSMAEWQNFQQNDIASTFDGFNVVDSTGYYKGVSERSKIVTIIVQSEDIPKAKALASRYARKFNQDSVMMVKIPVVEWSFIRQDYTN